LTTTRIGSELRPGIAKILAHPASPGYAAVLLKSSAVARAARHPTARGAHAV
jgi:hypothetical protein